jgi:hypothetical protein
VKPLTPAALTERVWELLVARGHGRPAPEEAKKARESGKAKKKRS